MAMNWTEIFSANRIIAQQASAKVNLPPKLTTRTLRLLSACSVLLPAWRSAMRVTQVIQRAEVQATRARYP